MMCTDIEREANEDMPRLEGIVSREESQDLARSLERTEAITIHKVPSKCADELLSRAFGRFTSSTFG